MNIERLIHNPDFLALVCGVGAFAVVALIWSAMLESDPLSGRMKSITERRNQLREQQVKKKETRKEQVNKTDFMKQFVQKFRMKQGKQMDALRLKLARAGYRSRDALFSYLFLKIALAPAFGLVAFFVLFVLKVGNLKPAMEFLVIISSALFGVAVPDIFLKNQSQKREDALRKGIPDALDLMVICAEAGLSLDSTFDRVSREIGPSCPELAEEIGLASVELSFLPDRAKALQNLADRVPLQGVMALANTLIQTEKYGTPLAQSLRVLSGEMREERIMAAEAKAAKLPATLTIPMILFILPPLFIVLLGPAILKVMSVMH